MVRERLTRRRAMEWAGASGLAILGIPTAGAQEHGRDPLDRYIVGTAAGRADVATREADEVYRVLDFGDIGMAVSGWYPDEAIDGMENNPHVRYVEAEGEMEAIDHTIEEDDGDPSQEQVLPWGIDRVDADVAHHEDETGGESSVSIIDTGIDPNHETLAVTGGKAFVDCEGDCAEDWDDDHGHGTHCAGTANALDNDIGVVGTSTEADLYAVKVLDGDGGGSFSDVAAGIEWTADEGIDIGSLSLGGDNSETVEDACEYAYGEGTLLVAAAGNDGSHPVFSTVSYPAAYEEVIAVSATDKEDEIAGFSSRGSEVELAAPGVDVLSTLPDDEYDHWDGTSMACPHVSGAGAQLMEHGYKNKEARTRLNETAEDIGLADREQGNGLVDVAAALGIDEDEEEQSLAVETQDASDVDVSTARLHGTLTELEGHDEATVYFEWGESGEGLPNTTEEQTREMTGDFYEDLTDLESETEYAFRAVAEAGEDEDRGETLTFTTDSDGDEDEIEEDPVIEEWSISTRTTGPWFRADIEWEVSDPDGALDEVTSELLDTNGGVLDSETSDVSGGTASGEHELRSRDEPDEVRLTVTDESDNKTSETKDY